MMYKRIPKVIKNKIVLEIATGPGLLAKNVAYAAKKMIATDYSDGMIKEAKKGNYPKNLEFEKADATNLPYADKTFDAVIISNALHVMPNPEKALREIDRVLKDDGILIAPNFIHSGQGFTSKLWSHILKIAGYMYLAARFVVQKTDILLVEPFDKGYHAGNNKHPFHTIIPGS